MLEHEDKEHEIANFIITYREEAGKRNIENGIKTPCVSGLVYCRSRAAVRPMASDCDNVA